VAREVLQLTSIDRLAIGSAHSLNNAFTAVLGEVGFLLDDYKEDPAIVEACEAIRRELERCAQLVRAIGLHRSHAAQSDDEVDLVRVTRDVEGLLRASMGRRIGLALETGEDALLVRGGAQPFASLLVTAAHLLASVMSSGETLTVRARRARARAYAMLELVAPRAGHEMVEPFRDPSLAANGDARVALAAIHGVLRALGGQLCVRSTPDRGLSVFFEFPLIDDAG
jgi:signal transduction histidine kinase